jgi:hypothetical protein
VERESAAEAIEWPEPDPKRWPDEKCRCGGVAKHNGFPGEYWCADCDTGYAYL